MDAHKTTNELPAKLIRMRPLSRLIGISPAQVAIWVNQTREGRLDMPFIRVSERILLFDPDAVMRWLLERSADHLPPPPLGRPRKSTQTA